MRLIQTPRQLGLPSLKVSPTSSFSPLYFSPDRRPSVNTSEPENFAGLVIISVVFGVPWYFMNRVLKLSDSGSTVTFTDAVSEALYVPGEPTLVNVLVYFTVIKVHQSDQGWYLFLLE